MDISRDKLIIVTGGAGFIGSCLIRLLNDRGYTNIVVVDNLGSSEKWKNLVGKRFIDILHKNQFFSWLVGREDEIGAIFHLGACSNTMEFDANYLLENNTHYTMRLCEWAVKHEIRFIYASSAATYGDGSNGFSDDENRLDELQPLNMYGYSKHLVDLWMKAQGLLDQVVGLKYFNIFGPNEYHKGPMASVFCKMVPQILEHGVVRLFKYSPNPSDLDRFGDGEQARDFLYGKDAARMTLGFLESSTCGLFNIGFGHPHTWNHLAKTVFEALDQPVNIEYVDMPAELQGKYQNYTCAEMEKFERAFPAHRLTSFEEAIFDYVRNYLVGGKTW